MFFHLFFQRFTTLFISCFLKQGKKHTSEKFIVELVKKVRKIFRKEAIPVIIQALNNAKPLIGFRTVKKGGVSFKVPFFLKSYDQFKVVFNWFLSLSKEPKKRYLTLLSKNIDQTALEQGYFIKKRNEIHKIAIQNKVFAHYR